jgi:dipeptidyl aminopeptidase/acylaminoacyl peptidase
MPLPSFSSSLPLVAAFTLAATASPLTAESLPDNLVVDGVPAIPAALKENAGRYLEMRGASFQGWHPQRREALILTRFGTTAQVHTVAMPGGARKQLTFFSEPVLGAAWEPGKGDRFVFSRDVGGSENYQLYSWEASSGKSLLLTNLAEGKSRNISAVWQPEGGQVYFCSNARNGKDMDVYFTEPAKGTDTITLVQNLTGGGWHTTDVFKAADFNVLVLLTNTVSANESSLHLLSMDATGKQLVELTPPAPAGKKISYAGGQFSADGQRVLTTSDGGSEFRQLRWIDVKTKAETVLTKDIPWDVEDFSLTRDDKIVAVVTNEDGASVLRFLDAATGAEKLRPKLPLGVISNLAWRRDGSELGFTFTSARSPSDVWSVKFPSGEVMRWTESETGGVDPNQFSEPEIVRLKSFDGLPISGLLYRPVSTPIKEFKGKRPLIINIHGGPEGQSRPVFQARNNYYMNELGCAMIYPNVRGSEGYGKTFLDLDNGFKREDSVKDIGAFLDWAKTDPGIDASRIMVMGGSYGGFMVLASLVNYSDRLRGGIDIVGVSNFRSFLKNTADYRRDLRRVEYGDEQDPAMAAFMDKISPLQQVAKIKAPLFVVQGLNDPRVPASEAEQIFQAVKSSGNTAWYLLAKDEGHGFRKKPNADYQFFAQILFLQETLLKATQ